MKNRIFFGSFGLIAILMASQLFVGCKSQIDDPAPSDFAQIRVANFADQTSPVDVYIQGVGQPIDTLPSAANLGFGLTSVYSSNLAAATSGTVYHVTIRPVNNRASELAHADVTVHPGEKWTVAVYHDVNSSTFPTDVIMDAPTLQAVNNTQVFVRFINAYRDNNQYTIKLGDNINGNVLAGPYPFRGHSDYIGIPYKSDTTYTFFLVNASDSVIARLSDQSFDAGSYHTLVYTADLSKVGHNAATTAGDALDSTRLRLFDDANAGNDLTSPSIPQGLRFNFVNALVPDGDPSPTLKRTYDQMGVTFNNDATYTFAGLKPFDVAPLNSFFVPTYMDGSQLIHVTQFTAIPLTAAILIKGQDINTSHDELFNYKAGARGDIKSDIPVSFIICDTLLSRKKLDDSTTVSQVAVPIPDEAHHGAGRIVIVNALAYSRQGGPTASYISVQVNGVQDKAFGAVTLGKKPTTYDNTLPDFPAGQPVTIKASLLAKPPGFPNVDTYSTTFTPKDGKIYEVILCGQRGNTVGNDPRFVIIETNPTFKGGDATN